MLKILGNESISSSYSSKNSAQSFQLKKNIMDLEYSSLGLVLKVRQIRNDFLNQAFFQKLKLTDL